jgi:hypothetical protein
LVLCVPIAASILLPGPVVAGGVVVVAPVLSDGGDHDGIADTGEVVELRLRLRNATGSGLTGVTVSLSTADTDLACLTVPQIAVGSFPSGATITTDAAILAVTDFARRTRVEQQLVATVDVHVASDQLPEAGMGQRLHLHLDLDAAGGAGPGTFFEGFEGPGFGAFAASNLDAEIQGGPWLEARCPYSVPPVCGTCEDCFVGTTAAHAAAFHWRIDPARAFAGAQSLHMGVPLDGGLGVTTPMDALEAIVLSEPIQLGLGRVCSVTRTVSCTSAAECAPGEACDEMRPELSFKHQVSLIDSRWLMPAGTSADRAIVQLQLAGAGDEPVGPWITVHPHTNVYDKQPASAFANCTFDPVDDGTGTSDFGPSSTCAPERSFAALGDTDEPFAPANIGDASDGPGLAGATGPGTWVESRFDLSAWRGRRVRLRLLTSSMGKVPDSPDGGEPHFATWQDYLLAFGLGNPHPYDDGWWIDDVTVTDVLADPVTWSVDTTERVGPDDSDADRVPDACDNCPQRSNLYQVDEDDDGLGDACDPCPVTPQNDDADADGTCDDSDVCPVTSDPLQIDGDLDGRGDACDDCPSAPNAGQEDTDLDGVGDACDPCPVGPATDSDGDGIACGADNCPATANPGQADADTDGAGDACDSCPADPLDDRDGDGSCDTADTCPDVPNPDQGPALLLTPDLPTGGNVTNFAVAPDGATGIFRADADEDEQFELYAVPLAGGPPLRVSSPLVATGDVGVPPSNYRFPVTADGETVLYVASAEVADRDELFATPLGGGAAVRLSARLGHGDEVDSWPTLSADGATAIYRDTAEVTGTRLLSAPVAGGSGTVLSEMGASAEGGAITPDGTAVVFVARRQGVSELYRVPIGGGAAIRLNGPLAANASVNAFALTPDGTRIAYRVLTTNNQGSLHGVSVSGGPSVQLSAPGQLVWDWRISPSGSRVVYIARVGGFDGLYSVPIAGGAVVRLDGAVPGQQVKNNWYFIDAADTTVVYRAEESGVGRYLYSVPVGGGTPMLLTDATLPPDRVWGVEISPDGASVVFRYGDFQTQQLFRVPIHGGAIVRLNPPFPTGRKVDDFVIGPDSQHVIYDADQQVAGMDELYRVPIGGGASVKISGTVSGSGIESGALVGYTLTPDGATAVYRAKHGAAQAIALFARALDPDPDQDGIFAACDPCPGIIDPHPPDADVDGFPAACADCDDTSASIHPEAEEINDGVDNQCPGDAGSGLVDEIAGTLELLEGGVLTWPAQTGAASYHVVRSTGAEFESGCTCWIATMATWTDAEEPAPDGAFFYLVRAAAPHNGSFGADASGVERAGACLAACGP